MADVSVRPAALPDAAVLAELQGRAWRLAYAQVLPADVLDDLADLDSDRDGGSGGTGVAAGLEQAWADAIVRPPTARHRVLVACAGAAVVGGAALGPAEDEDADAGSDAEVLAFGVDPDHRRQGHGSRLLAASVDFLRGAGFGRASVWLDSDDAAGQGLFAASGWAADGSTRRLDLDGDGSVVVDQVRYHTDLAEGLPR